MSERPSRPSSPYLEPPRKSVEVEDPGAPDSVSNSDEEYFSDASEGNSRSHSRLASGRSSPVPRTRVEKVDDAPSYGEIPGTYAYEKRELDAVPDEVEVIPEGSRSRSSSTVGLQRSLTPGGSPIPRTVVEKVDLDQPSYGEVAGTPAYEQRKMDAVPDVVTRLSNSEGSTPSSEEPTVVDSADTPVPETLVTKVDSPVESMSAEPHAHRRRPSDALPDATETVPDAPDVELSLSSSPEHQNHARRRSTLTGDEATHDDFDDFAEGDDDDFGDFGDDFQEPDTDIAEPEPSQPITPPSVPPLIEFDDVQSLSDVFTALDESLDRLFPASKQDFSTQSPIEPIPNSSAIFNTERSLSLWSQLVAPPPLQPQNWVKSRIRRLFLVSLGVPVDLDEILPASKQKKLVLPSINLGGSDPTGAGSHSQSQARKDPQSGPNSPRNSGTANRQRASRRREPSPAPELDLTAVRRLCATTDAALDGFTDLELKIHVKDLEHVTLRASTVLEFWLKRRDGLISEKEAFEGVIENLVNHARRVRK